MAMANIDSEIGHLLNYVKTTDCSYERNGKRHSGIEAYKHIKRKSDYYEDEIESAEDFIQYSATKSKMSGKYYLIHCPSQPVVKSRDWLLIELAKFRNMGKG